MRFSRILVVGLLVLPALPAAAQFNLLSSLGRRPLSNSDSDMLLSSINDLNRDPHVAVGSSEKWSNPATKSRGTSAVTQITQQNGMTCHVVHAEVFVRGRTPPNTYDLTWCLTPRGEWKIAS